MLQIRTFVFNEFQENTYVVWDDTKECAIIDPGCYHPHETKALEDFIRDEKLKPVKLLNTHCHIDHILGNQHVSKQYGLSLHLHEGELETYRDTDRWAAMFNLPKFVIPENKVFISEGDEISFGNTRLKVLFTPGHSVASVCFYHDLSNTLVSGDVLFFESIGRTDLPGGNFDRLVQSIRNVVYRLPDETRVYSGHGPVTTIEHEKNFNPFVPEIN